MRILVAVASKHGATAEIGEALGETLRGAGHTVYLTEPENVDSLDGIDVVVLGSAVYAGRWMESARRFVERHHLQLKARPVWLFSSGPIGEPLSPTEPSIDGVRLERELDARSHRTFPGRLDPTGLSWIERTVTSMVKAPDGDFRDWEAINDWGAEIAAAALATEAVLA